MNPKVQVILKRFLRAFVTGALSTAVFITVNDATTWSELYSAIQVFGISFIIGGLNGVLLALDKLYRWEE